MLHYCKKPGLDTRATAAVARSIYDHIRERMPMYISLSVERMCELDREPGGIDCSAEKADATGVREGGVFRDAYGLAQILADFGVS